MEKEQGQEFLLRFGENLKKLRMARGLSLRELSSLCSVDHSDIAKMEKGLVNVTILTVLELATALEVKAKRLLEME